MNMAASDPFEGLATFLVVAERASFTRAAADLGLSVQAVSQTIRGLEGRLGVLLFQRTTRRVGLTEAGSALHRRLKPVVSEVHEAIEALDRLRHRPAGHLRLNVSHLAVQLVVEPVTPLMRQAYPDISLDIRIDDSPGDPAAGGFDAGISIGEFVALDMIGIPLTPDIIWSVVGSPSYFAERGRPDKPEDLMRHECIRFRLPKTGAVYRWEFAREGREFSVDVRGSITTPDGPLNCAFARKGLGLTYAPDLAVTEDLRLGRLENVLQPYMPRSPGLFLYFPSRAQDQPKLRAFIDLAKTALRFPSQEPRRRRGQATG
jgi:DNA-binding transcriptional LysR family regulator